MTNKDPVHDEYKDMDFSQAKPVSEIPALKALQASDKDRITIRIDQTILAEFKAKAEATGGNYQTLINEALKQYLLGESLQDVIKQTIRQELHHAR